MLNQAQPVTCTSLSYLAGDSLPSFLHSLVLAKLQSVLQSDAPAPAPAASTPSQDTSVPAWLTGTELTTYLSSLQSEIEHTARTLYYRVHTCLSVALDDLTQEGMIAAWQATLRYDAAKVVDARSFRGFCMKRAHGAMLMYLRTLGRESALSLEHYLEVDTEDGTRTRELADTPVQHRLASLSERRRILSAMRQLTRNQQLIVMAHFRIEDGKGRCLTLSDVQARLQLSASAIYSTKARALKKLARLL